MCSLNDRINFRRRTGFQNAIFGGAWWNQASILRKDAKKKIFISLLNVLKRSIFCYCFDWCYIVKCRQILVLMIKGNVLVKYNQSAGVDNLCRFLFSRTNLLSKIIWYLYALWAFSVISFVQTSRSLQTISCTNLFKTAKHLGMLNQHSLIWDQI